MKHQRMQLHNPIDGRKVVKVLPVGELFKAFEAGKNAKMRGDFRISPYYEVPPLDHYWFAGYDGKTWKEAEGVEVA